MDGDFNKETDSREKEATPLKSSSKSSNCACGGNCGCGKGNYTYIRWASDVNGLNFSTSRTEGGIERCFQGIIVSPNKLDETTQSFEALFFQRWVNACETDCCGGCDWADYLPANTGVANYLNVWTYETFTTPISNTQDLTVQNRISLRKFIHLDVVTPPIIFLGPDGLPLVSGQTYALEITLATNTAVSSTDAMEFSFGDGPLATVWTVDQNTTPGVYTLLMTAADGTFNASTLVCKTLQPASNTNESHYIIEDFRIGSEDCYDPNAGGTNSDEKFKMDAQDTQAGYWTDKVSIGGGLSQTISTDVNGVKTTQLSAVSYTTVNSIKLGSSIANGDVEFIGSGISMNTSVNPVSITWSMPNHTHTLSDITDAGTAAGSDIEDFAAAEHTHTLEDITDAGTAAGADIEDFAPASHTHTASEITDFDTEVSNNVDVSANTSKRHDAMTLNSGQVTQDSANLSGQELEMSLATTSTAGVMSAADKTKLDGLSQGTGEANTGSNLGSDAAVFSAKVGVDLQFRTLKAGTGIGISQGATEIEITSTGQSGEVNTASNNGAGVGLYETKTGSDLEFKSIKSSDVTIDIDDLTGTGEVDLVVNESVLDVANMQDSRKPFQTITAAGSTYTWQYRQYYNAKIVIASGGNYDLLITNAQDGDYGTLIVQNSVGDSSVTLSIPNGANKQAPYSKVVAGGNGIITLTPNAFDVFCWVYDGTTFWWTYGHNYT